MSSNKSKLWHLERINLLKNLSEEEMEELVKKTTFKLAEKNQYIYFPEEPSKVVFFLKEGRVKIGTYSEDGKEVIKAILYPGEVFGEMGVLGEDRRKDFAIAMDDNTRMCTISVDEFKDILNQNPHLSLEMGRNIGEKMRRIERRLESLIFKDARERIIQFMKEMAEHYGKAIGEEILVKHDLTHQDIANLTATSRQTVTTVLNELKEEDQIYMERKKFLIRDLKSLK
ncbi:MAG: cAMP-binding protein [Flavobacteriales bacterium]|nr:cAMP-binding protein [Flavobacteriales bacterium]|tara:strand:+ start:1202 stop:1885 length:684 start_codon:yes stop_codon:yes gene_type:complete